MVATSTPVEMAKTAIDRLTQEQRIALTIEIIRDIGCPHCIQQLTRLQVITGQALTALKKSEMTIGEIQDGDDVQEKAMARIEAARRMDALSEPKQRLIDPDGSIMSQRLARRRENNLKRAQEVLSIIQGTILPSLPEQGNAAFQRNAERLSILLFGE